MTLEQTDQVLGTHLEKRFSRHTMRTERNKVRLGYEAKDIDFGCILDAIALYAGRFSQPETGIYENILILPILSYKTPLGPDEAIEIAKYVAAFRPNSNWEIQTRNESGTEIILPFADSENAQARIIIHNGEAPINGQHIRDQLGLETEAKIPTIVLAGAKQFVPQTISANVIEQNNPNTIFQGIASFPSYAKK